MVTAAIVPFPTFTNDSEVNNLEEEGDEGGAVNIYWGMTKKTKSPSTLTHSWARVHQVHPDELEIYHRLSEGPELVALQQSAPPKRSITLGRSMTTATSVSIGRSVIGVSNGTFLSQRTQLLASQRTQLDPSIESKISESHLEDEEFRKNYAESHAMTLGELGSPGVAVSTSTKRVVVQDSLARSETRCQQDLYPCNDEKLGILAPPGRPGMGTSTSVGNNGKLRLSKIQM